MWRYVLRIPGSPSLAAGSRASYILLIVIFPLSPDTRVSSLLEDPDPQPISPGGTQPLDGPSIKDFFSPFPYRKISSSQKISLCLSELQAPIRELMVHPQCPSSKLKTTCLEQG